MHSILFAGSDPMISLPTLARLTRRGWVGAVLSAPAHAQGTRNNGAAESEVVQFARAHKLPVFQYKKLDQHACDEIAKLRCNGLVCVAYGNYFPAAFLSLFPSPPTTPTQANEAEASLPGVGTMNLHPSLLPRFRGPSPIQATLLSGDRYGGVSIIKIAKKMDGGEILAQERLPITPQTTREELEHWCAERGGSNYRKAITQRR